MKNIVKIVTISCTFFLVAISIGFKTYKNAIAQSSEIHVVNYNGSGFDPDNLTIPVNDTVEFANISSTFVEVRSDPHPIHTNYPPLNLGLISPGESKSLQFTDTGTFSYHNHLNETQTGTIIVNAPESTATPTNTPTPVNTPTPSADANSDGSINGIDLIVWMLNFGKQTQNGKTSGDFNNDNSVNLADYVVWISNYLF